MTKLSPERWARLEELFQAALPLNPHERGALLDRECAGDAALQREVASLFAHVAGIIDRLGAVRKLHVPVPRPGYASLPACSLGIGRIDAEWPPSGMNASDAETARWKRCVPRNAPRYGGDQ